ncbi:ATP-binding cassette domain-containing protein [Longispora urticae]
MTSGWALLRECLRGRGKTYAWLAFWSVVEAAPALTGGWLVAAAVDRGFLRGELLTGFAFLGLLGISVAVKALATRQLLPSLAAVVEPMRDALVRVVVSGALDRVIAGQRPDLAGAARITGQVESVRTHVSILMRSLREVAMTMLATAVGLTALAPAAAGIVLTPLIAVVALYLLLLRALARRQRELIVADEVIATEAGRALLGIRDVVASAAVERVATDVGAAIDAQARASRALARAGAVRLVVVAVGGQLPTVLLLALAPLLVRNGQLSAGQILGVLTYLLTSLAPAVRTLVGSVGTRITQLGVVLARIAQAADAPSAQANSGCSLPVEAALEARDITFAYGPHAVPVIAKLTLTLPEGGHLAVVGPSGIGKSTLASILAGLTEPDHGIVTLGGVPVNLITPRLLRTAITVIPQQSYVFAGTLRENLCYQQPDATEADIDAAVEAIGLRSLVDRLGGYGAMLVAPTATLSSGERQQISLARVYLSSARVVILDEATCHLDPVAEELVEKAFAARPGSLIIIAHRISSARRADHILLLDGDQAISGSHSELIESSPLYSDLAGNWSWERDAE